MTFYAVDHESGERLSFLNQDDVYYMRHHYPAVVATEPAKMSDQYQFMSTFDLARHMEEKHGLQLAYIGQQRSRARDPRHQEHVLRFRMPTHKFDMKDSVPEIVLMNSHNGRCTLRVYLGVFRFVCANGLIMADSGMERVTMRHMGADHTQVMAQRIVDTAVRKMKVQASRINLMADILLMPHEQVNLAKAMMRSRKMPDWVTEAMVLESHRNADDIDEDGKRSLWVTFNVIQENLLNRVLERPLVDPTKSQRRSQTRPINSVRSNVLLNEGLWSELENFIETVSKKRDDFGLIIRKEEVEPEVTEA